jgi:protein-tyrosine-phosphatase
MAEVGIDISQQTPKVLTTEAVQASDVGDHHGLR